MSSLDNDRATDASLNTYCLRTELRADDECIEKILDNLEYEWAKETIIDETETAKFETSVYTVSSNYSFNYVLASLYFAIKSQNPDLHRCYQTFNSGNSPKEFDDFNDPSKLISDLLK